MTLRDKRFNGFSAGVKLATALKTLHMFQIILVTLPPTESLQSKLFGTFQEIQRFSCFISSVDV